MTDELSNRKYCVCLVFTEEAPQSVYLNLIPAVIPANKYYYEKAICLISEFPFFENLKTFLGELYRIQVSSSCSTYIERYISYFTESVSINTNEITKALAFDIGNSSLKFYAQPIYFRESDYFKDDIYLALVATMSLETFLEVLKFILLEGKLIFVSKSCNLLTNVITNLISLLFPFTWPHILIPILPEKMLQFIQAPVPFIMGINNIKDLTDGLSDDVMVISLDTRKILNQPKEKIPDPPKSLYDKFKVSLKKCFSGDFSEELAFFIDSFDDVCFQIGMLYDENKFNSMDLKEIVYEFIVGFFKNYDKYWRTPIKMSIEQSEFNFDAFRKDFSSTSADSFTYRMTETSIFIFFVESKVELLNFVFENLTLKKGEHFFQVYDPTVSKILDSVETYCKKMEQPLSALIYPTFPKLDASKYVQSTAKDACYNTKFIFDKDEWCYNFINFKSKDWANYLCLAVYEIWVQIVIVYMHYHLNVDCTGEIFKFLNFIVSHLKTKKSIQPSRNMIYKLIKCYASLGYRLNMDYHNEIDTLIKMIPNSSKGAAYFALIEGMVKVIPNSSHSNPIKNIEYSNLKVNKQSSNNLYRGSALFRKMSDKKQSKVSNHSISSEEDYSGSVRVFLESSAFLNYDYCPSCLNTDLGKIDSMTFDIILSSFKKDKFFSQIICPDCNTLFSPNLYMVHILQKSPDSIDSVKWLSVSHLMKEIENLFRTNGELSFIPSLSQNYKLTKTIFWNLLFYFKLFGLPTFVLDKDYHFELLKSELEQSIQILEGKAFSQIKAYEQPKKLERTVTSIDTTETIVYINTQPSGNPSTKNSYMYWEILLSSKL